MRDMSKKELLDDAHERLAKDARYLLSGAEPMDIPSKGDGYWISKNRVSRLHRAVGEVELIHDSVAEDTDA